MIDSKQCKFKYEMTALKSIGAEVGHILLVNDEKVGFIDFNIKDRELRIHQIDFDRYFGDNKREKLGTIFVKLLSHYAWLNNDCKTVKAREVTKNALGEKLFKDGLTFDLCREEEWCKKIIDVIKG